MNATTALMSAIRSCLYGDLDSSIDPETRGAIFDMLTNGYIPTSRIPYVVPVNNMARLTSRQLTLSNLDTKPAPRLAIPPRSFAGVSHFGEISRWANQGIQKEIKKQEVNEAYFDLLLHCKYSTGHSEHDVSRWADLFHLMTMVILPPDRDDDTPTLRARM